MRFLFLMLLACSVAAQIPTIPSGFNFPPKSNSGGGTDPRTVSGLVIYTDVNLETTNSSGTTPTDGQVVSGWTDYSGNNYHLRSVNANGPKYILHLGPTNGPAITISNTMTGAALTNSAGGGSYAQPNTFIFVYFDIAASHGGAVLNTISGQTTQINQPAGNIEQFYAGSAISGIAGLNGHWWVLTVIFNGTSSAYRTNGVTVASSVNMGTGTCPGITWGNYFNKSSTGDMVIAALCWFNGVSDTNTIHGVEKYFGNEFNIPIF